MSDPKQPKASPAVLRRMLREYRFERPMTALAILIAVAYSGAELMPALYIRNAINYLQDWTFAGRGSGIVIWPFVACIALIAVIHNLLSFSQTIARTELGTRVTNRLRERVYETVQRHSLAYHKTTTTGDLIARSTRDVQNMARFINGAAFTAADLLIFLTGAIIILIRINPVFALIALSPLPLALYLTMRFGARVRTMWKDASDTYGKVTTTLQENIAGARVVRAFAQEKAEEKRFGARAGDYVTRIIHALEFWIIRMILSNLTFSLVMPIALFYGSYAAVRGQIEIGDIVLCFLYMRPVEQRLRQISQIMEDFQNAAASAERVFEILDEEPGIRSRPGARPMPPSPAGSGARIEFRNVSFGYTPEKPVLEDICFTAEPGRTVAVVGHTASGKSTLLSLIPRFHDPTAGAVFINGVDVRDVKLADLRRAVGIIFQETFLFSASVRDNIAYGRPGASFETIRAAAEAARAHEFILELEDGYDTVIGERGVTLSGGQAQRLAIARAILLDPKVLLMDDATASVDSETERLIRETMRAVAEGRTNLVVAHRISSVAHADRILVLEAGRIAEQGTHAELVALGGIYRRMCDQQFRGRIDED